MMLYNQSGEKLQSAVLKNSSLMFENGAAKERFKKKIATGFILQAFIKRWDERRQMDFSFYLAAKLWIGLI